MNGFAYADFLVNFTRSEAVLRAFQGSYENFLSVCRRNCGTFFIRLQAQRESCSGIPATTAASYGNRHRKDGCR
jgi:hypothetical protein